MQHLNKIFLTFCYIFLLIIASQSILAAKKNEPLDRIIAVINDTVITQSELNEAMQTAQKQLMSSNISLPPQDVFRKQVLDQLINKKLQMQAAEQMNIKVTDTDVDKALKTIAQQNKFTVSELYQKVTETGMSTKQYRKEIHDAILLQQIQQQAVASRITISPQEVDDFIHSKSWQAFNSKEYHVKDILIPIPETPTPQQISDAKNRADGLITKIHKGLNFNEAAAAESGENNALQGGDLGWRKLPEIPTAFSNDLIHMQIREVTGPIQTQNGFHILMLDGIRNIAARKNLAQEKQQVQQLIFQRKLEEGIQNWTSKIRSEAFINLHPEL